MLCHCVAPLGESLEFSSLFLCFHNLVNVIQAYRIATELHFHTET